MKLFRESNDWELYELPPIKRSYEYDNKFYFLQFPWMYLYVESGDVIIFGSFDRLKSVNDEIFYMPIGHNYVDGLCLGDNTLADLPDCIFSSNEYLPGHIVDLLQGSHSLNQDEFFELWEEDFGYFKMIAESLAKTILRHVTSISSL